MRILKARYFGMCFGVRDAIDLALEQAQHEPLTILGDLVHNESVMAQLRSRGIHVARNAADVTTRKVMVTAHGASDTAIRNARERGFLVTEATCPLVHLAHRAVAKLVRDGYHPLIVGKRDHVEVRGITEDLAECDVILTAEDVAQLRERPRFGVVAQTTQPIDRVRGLVELLRTRFPAAEVCFVDTVCQPTKQRQASAIETAQESDVMIVIGGVNSNNTRELAETCAKYCAHVYHVQTSTDLRSEWFEAAGTVGITAGTSTPDSLVSEVENWLRKWAMQTTPGGVSVRERSLAVMSNLKAA